MLKNYFKIAWRNLWNNRLYTVTSITGLSIGFTVFVLVLLYVNYEKSYDQWDGRLAQVYRVGVSERNRVGLEQSPSVQYPLGTFLAEECPEVTQMTRTRISDGETLITLNEQQFYETKVVNADSNFFTVFPYHFLYGNSHTALNRPNTAVITRTMSAKLFGNTDPVGKTFTVNLREHYTVTGVIEKQGPSHLDFNICLSYHSKHFVDNWFMRNHDTYVRLDPKTVLIALQEKVTRYYTAHYARSYMNGRPAQTGEIKDPATWLANQHGITELGVFFEPVKGIHLQPLGFEEWSAQNAIYDFNRANQRPIQVFSLIALLVLILACINYTNIAIAQGSKRAKETGMRKAMGANRRQLIFQFMTESFLQCILALILALGLSIILKNILNHTFQLSLSLWNTFLPYQNEQLIGQLMAIVLLVTLVAGTYPAFVLSRYKPARILKGDLKTVKGHWLRNSLVVFQYTIAYCFTIGVVIIFLQLRFMRNNDPGFDTEQVLRIEAVRTILFPGQAGDRSDFVKQELLKQPGVLAVSSGQIYPGQPYAGAIQTAIYDGNEQLDMQFSLINFDYFHTLGMSIVQGRDFSPTFAQDTIDAAVINETAAQRMGWHEPIGKRLDFLGKKYQIIGVLKNNHLSGYEDRVLPQIYMIGVAQPSNFSGHRFIFVKIDGRKAPEAIKAVSSFWKTLEPEFPIRLSWLNDDFTKLLEKHERFGKLIAGLTATALTIAAMGIFSLSAFSTQQRIKEIGIRKVFGASVANITKHLSNDFIKLVWIAFVIAFPIAWWMTNKWLEDFAYHIEYHWWMFMLAGVATIIVAMFAVSLQTIKAALANPVDSLRNE